MYKNIIPQQALKTDTLLNIFQVYAVNGIITPSCNEVLDEELRKLWVKTDSVVYM